MDSYHRSHPPRTHLYSRPYNIVCHYPPSLLRARVTPPLPQPSYLLCTHAYGATANPVRKRPVQTCAGLRRQKSAGCAIVA